MKQNNYFRRTLSAVLLLLTSTLAWAYDFEADGIYYNINSDKATVSVTYDSGYNSYSGIVDIPPTVNYDGKTYRVTSIGDWAFYNCRSLTSIVIPDGVTSIGDRAFSICNTLTSIVIPDGVTSIGNMAFGQCYLLKSINIPSSVTSIGDNAFYNCNTLISINIPDGVTSIGNSTFCKCQSLKSINIPDGVTSIEDYAFQFCYSLTSINIPEGVTRIGSAAFDGCYSLTSINIPSSVTSIGNGSLVVSDQPFVGCYGLKSITISEDNPVYDSRENCNAIIETATNTLISGCQNTIIPDGVTSIGTSAFYSCRTLTSITFPKSVTSIGAYAFQHCYGLTFIDIPNSMTSIGDDAFWQCIGLTTVICRSENVPELGVNVFYLPRTLYVPASALEAYKAADQWKNIGTILPLEEEEEEEHAVTLAIGEAHYATFMAPFEVEIPANVEAYTVTGIKADGETLQLKELTGIIPTNTPVVLYSPDIVNKSVRGMRTTTETAYTEGLLTGVYKSKNVPEGSYILQNQEGKVAFYRAGRTLPMPTVTPNHAYLTLPSTASGVNALRFGTDDEATAIQSVAGSQEKTAIYDLTGRRVEKATKGMYIIDGKKVMVK